MGRHRKCRRIPWKMLTLTAVAAGGAIGFLTAGSPPVVQGASHAFPQPHLPLRVKAPVQAATAVYTAGEGQSLWSIAHDKCGDGNDWKNLATANRISYPYPVTPGQKITLSCGKTA